MLLLTGTTGYYNTKAQQIHYICKYFSQKVKNEIQGT